MSDTIARNPVPGEGPNDYELQQGDSDVQRQTATAPQDVTAFGQHVADVSEQVPEERKFQFSANNPFGPEAGARRAHATSGPGVDGRDVNITNAPGDGLKFNTLSGPNNVINNQGKVRINEIAEGASLSLPDNGGDVRVKFNNGHLRTHNNTNFIGVSQNNGALDVEENKGSVKVKENGTEGDVTLGRPGVAGISQGGFPGFRHSGRVDIANNHGTFEQHYRNGSLGQVLNLNRTSEVHRSTEVHAQPSGPGGKLHTPAAKGGGLVLGTVGVLTTVGVGAANWEGTYTNSKGLANPTPHPSSATPTVALPPTATATEETPAVSATPHLDRISREIGLSKESGRPASADAEVPHESAPKIRI